MQRQAREFLRRADLEMLGETIDVRSSELDPLRAVAVIEDYKPLDVECAAVNLALLAAIRDRYPEWRLLVDGDGGDENLKDYPIEENRELTIRSVVNNRMLYQEGWGVESIKHSLTYSGGYSRGCVRSFACAREFGFNSFSPYTRPSVIAVAEAIPFAALTEGSTERLYALKGDIVAPRNSRGPRRGYAGLSKAPISARVGFRGCGRPAVSPGRGALPPALRDAARGTYIGMPSASPMEVAGTTDRIRRLRGSKPVVDPWKAHGSALDSERRPDGTIERALTIFLAGAECPFTCSFCDLWRYTIDGPTPAGALPTQIADTLATLDESAGDGSSSTTPAISSTDAPCRSTICRESPSCAPRSPASPSSRTRARSVG